MDALDCCVLHHGRGHAQVTHEFLHRPSDEPLRRRGDGLNSMASLVWHIARCEEALNVLLAGRPHILDDEPWLPQLNPAVRDVGTGMADDEVSDVRARLELAALHGYDVTGGRRTVLTSRSALEGEREQVTVLFADLKGSMEWLPEGDPEAARQLLEPVVARMMAA